MLKRLQFASDTLGGAVIFLWTWLIISIFTVMSVLIFPMAVLKTAPEARIVEGVNGYSTLEAGTGDIGGEIFKLRGEWEFYPNRLYTFEDFTNGRVEEPRIASFPHFWRDEPAGVIGRAGYSTYRMRVRVPSSFDGIGIYSRYQYSAYEIFLNDTLICSAGVVSEDFGEHKTAYLPTNGYTYATIGGEGRTFSVILHVQNAVSNSGGLGNDVFIGSSESVKNLRTVLLVTNGLISGGLLLLFACFLLIYLSGREKREYLDYTIVSLVSLFISLTNGGESLMYSIGLDSVLLTRLEYCAFITGVFFANYSAIRSLVKSKPVFYIAHIYTALANAFFLFAPLSVSSDVRISIITIAVSFFSLPLANSLKSAVTKHDFESVTSFGSYVIVVAGILYFLFGKAPWDSIDIFSIVIIIHCILQMLIFLLKYRKTEQTLKNMTETLEDRIVDRTIELTLMKEHAEAASLSKSHFLANMSHEIRTPMNAIMGISDLMRTDNLDKQQLSYLMDIKKSSKALLQIINDILDFSKIEAGKLEIIPVHFNLMAAYDNICSICSFSASSNNLEFRHYFAPDVPHYIFGDEIRYRQVILNIINNAIKYTKKGRVDFKIEKVELYGQTFLSFTVEDTGIGIKQEDLPKLFNAFEQLDSASNRKILGTGLGLSICRQLVTLMNGDIQVESEYGKGSVFTVYLPLEEGDSDKVIKQETYIPVIANDAKVLVVDDNSINLTVAAGFLSIHAIQPDTALSGAEAIEKIKSNMYDLVFMDHMMPEMDGVEATGIIRSMEGGRFSGLPIVTLTANAVSGAQDIFKAAGMNDFLSKPINATDLNLKLARWLPAEKISCGNCAAGYAAGYFEKSAGDAGGADNDIFDRLCQIKGLDIAAGLTNIANNKPAYLVMLRQYCSEAGKYSADILRDAETGDWEDYTIKLHAMKGIFANIGDSELSSRAHSLESASRNKEYSLCQSRTAAFCESMGILRDKLMAAGLTDADMPAEKTVIGARELSQRLGDLRSACMTGDSDLADEIVMELSKRSFDSQTDAELAEIYVMAGLFDFELAADRINNLLTRI